ncbi:MAG: pyruvate formate lyase-activating protein [Polyangiaceae bacterium]|nr:pyruvate formate lyase-activating protein [Polyangiaceae bacterium]
MASGAIGSVHSFEVGSAVDGPGVRFVLWTAGCCFRCQYCHNPDTWRIKNGRLLTIEQVMEEVGKYVRFLSAAGGGVTISGGEPLVQAPFVCRILRGCERLGVHTVLETNGYLGHRLSDADLETIDLVLLDLKSWDPATHRRVTGREIGPVLRFARRLSDLGKPAWVRFVLVPGLTDAPENVGGLADFVATLRNVERVEVLPFHQLGRFKWERLGVDYPLRDASPPGPELVERVVEELRARGLEAS